MVVDDDPYILKILEAYFQKLEIAVKYKAVDGQDAYQKFVDVYNENPLRVPTLITMDINMPNMDGK